MTKWTLIILAAISLSCVAKQQGAFMQACKDACGSHGVQYVSFQQDICICFPKEQKE
jgi:hypothetical protein